MTSLGQAIAAWLRAAPGPIYGDTHDACILAAHEKSKIKCDANEFGVALSRVGYAPMQRIKHGDDGKPKYWLLALPEH